MPKQKGPHKIEGFFDGKIYYRMGNEWYVRNSSAPSKKKVEKDPAFKALRDYSKEFGVASSVGSCFKKSFGSVLDTVSDKHITRHISSLFARLIHRGHGEQGKRSIEILPNGDLFADFQFKEAHNFNYVFKVPFALIPDESRKEVSLCVPEYAGSAGIVEAPGATHFRMILSLVLFSDYVFHEATKCYCPVEPAIHKICVTEYSDLLSLDGTVDAFDLKAKLHINPDLPDSVGVVASTGIEFYQMAGGKPYFLETMSCMKIAGVF